MEKTKIHFLCWILILLMLIMDVRSAHNFQHGRKTRLPRGISRTVAQMFFGGKPASDKLPASVTTTKFVPASSSQYSYSAPPSYNNNDPDTFYGQYFSNSFSQPQPHQASNHDYVSQVWNSDHGSSFNYAEPQFDEGFNYQSQSSPSYQFQAGQPFIATLSQNYGTSTTTPSTISRLTQDGFQRLSKGREVIRDKWGSYMKKLRRSTGTFSFGNNKKQSPIIPSTHFLQPYGHGEMFVDPFNWGRPSDHQDHSY